MPHVTFELEENQNKSLLYLQGKDCCLLCSTLVHLRHLHGLVGKASLHNQLTCSFEYFTALYDWNSADNMIIENSRKPK